MLSTTGWLTRCFQQANTSASAWAMRRAGASPLHQAASVGDCDTVDLLIRSGADVNGQTRRGQTPLHLAARANQSRTAAMLLHRGADHTIPDRRGRRPLQVPFVSNETLHCIRQQYRRQHVYTGPCLPDQTAVVQPWLDELQRAGIVHIPGLLDGEQLHRMRADFARFIDTIDRHVARGEGLFQHYDEEQHWWEQDLAYVCNNAFRYSPALTELCCRNEIVEVANRYTGSFAQVTRGVAMRYLPLAPRDTDMFGWHHDLEEKRLKLLVLLTDLGPNDQYMSYVVGSHELLYPYEMFEHNACSLEYCQKHVGSVEVRNTVGRAGDVFLFDSNGIHRGNRRAGGRVRDAFFVEYCADRSDVWGGDIDRDLLNSLELPLGNPFESMLAVEKKWNLPRTRTKPMWLETLANVEAWR